MNKRCKDALYHAWTNTTPEQVSAYNRGYYQKNKADWVTRKEKREQHNYWNSSILNANTDKAFLTKVGEKTREKLDFEKAGEKVYDAVDAGKKAIETVIENRKKVHEERGDVTNTIFAILKRGFSWLSKWFS